MARRRSRRARSRCGSRENRLAQAQLADPCARARHARRATTRRRACVRLAADGRRDTPNPAFRKIEIVVAQPRPARLRARAARRLCRQCAHALDVTRAVARLHARRSARRDRDPRARRRARVARDGGDDRQRSAPRGRARALAAARRAADARRSRPALRRFRDPRGTARDRGRGVVARGRRRGGQYAARLHARRSVCDRRAGKRRPARRLPVARRPRRSRCTGRTSTTSPPRCRRAMRSPTTSPASASPRSRPTIAGPLVAVAGQRRHSARRAHRAHARRRQHVDRLLALQ